MFTLVNCNDQFKTLTLRYAFCYTKKTNKIRHLLLLLLLCQRCNIIIYIYTRLFLT